jgi:hypothetical protein
MSALATRRSALPPPLRGRVGERGGRELMHVLIPPSLFLPRMGGGDQNIEAVP